MKNVNFKQNFKDYEQKLVKYPKFWKLDLILPYALDFKFFQEKTKNDKITVFERVLNKNWSNVPLCRQRFWKLNIEKWINGLKWATKSLFLIKKWVFTNEFLQFKGMWELCECQNWILDGFLSWKMVSELQKAGKFWVFLRKKAS